MHDETLVNFGEEVKALGGGKVAGYLVRYHAPDAQGDVFLPDTYFGVEHLKSVPIYYDHGLRRDTLGKQLGPRPIGEGTLESRPDGLWLEGNVDLSREPVKALYGDVRSGRIGWSSGSASRFVEREPMPGNPAVKSVRTWPINDASLTPIPVDPNNRAYAIKALIESTGGEGVSPSLLERSERLVSDAAEVVALWDRAVKARQIEGRNLSEVKRAALAELRDALAGLVDATEPRATGDELDEVRRLLLRSQIQHGFP